MKLVVCAVDASVNEPARVSEPLVREVDDCSVPCYECGRLFRSITDVRNHAHRAHGFKASARFYTPSNTCLACLTSFGSRDAIIQHLTDRKASMDLLFNVYAPLPTEIVSMLDKEAITVRKSRVPKAPSMRKHGQCVDAQMASPQKRALCVHDV